MIQKYAQKKKNMNKNKLTICIDYIICNKETECSACPNYLANSVFPIKKAHGFYHGL